MSASKGLTSVADISRVHAAERPEAVALDFKDRLTSYAELDKRANRVAQGLIGLGQKPGARVGYLGKNCDRYFEVLFGAFKARNVIVGVNWRLAPPEIAYVLNDAGCEVIFVGKGYTETIRKILPDCPQLKTVIAIDGGEPGWPDFETWRDGQPATDPMLPVGPDDDVIQLYTSGTTGHPKGVQLTNANYMALIACAREMGLADYTPEDAVLVAMPFFHVAGVNIGLLALVNGARAVILEDIDAVEVLRLIEAKEMMGCGFLQLYRLTETCGGGTYLAPEDHDPARGKLRSCGRPAPGHSVRVVDGDGKALDAHAVGEIQIKAPNLMKGYWNRQDATDKAIIDDWFFTGDAGYFDEDGFLYIHDRVKDMIVSGGENVYPADVENAIAAHPAVADVAVIGVPDARWGEAVKAVVVLKPGAEPDPAGITAFARERIAGYKLPKSIDLIDALPRNPTGKILRRELRKPYWEGRDRQVS